jgi:hypothetical protein
MENQRNHNLAGSFGEILNQENHHHHYQINNSKDFLYNTLDGKVLLNILFKFKFFFL